MSHSQVRSPSAALNSPSKTVSVKTGTAGGAGAHGNVTAGDTITSTFEVKNTGHTCLAVTSIVDEKAGEVECPYVVDMAGEERWLVAFRTFDLGCVGGKDFVGLQGFVFLWFLDLSFKLRAESNCFMGSAYVFPCVSCATGNPESEG